MNQRRWLFLIVLSSLAVFINSCSKPPASPSLGKTDNYTYTQMRRTMDVHAPRVPLNGFAPERLAGMDGVLDIKNIRSITTFKAWGLYPAFAFIESDRHMAWMFYNTGSLEEPVWNLVKLAGNPDVAGDGAGASTWFSEPTAIVASSFVMPANDPTYGAYDMAFLYVADKNNQKIKVLTVMRFKEGAVAGAINTFSADINVGENPTGLAINSTGTILYVGTQQGNIRQYNALTTELIATPTTLGISNLQGMDVDDTHIYFMSGNEAFKAPIDGDYSTTKVGLISTDGKLKGNETDWKDIKVHGNYAYIADSSVASGSTEGSCIYRVKKDGSDASYNVYAGSQTEAGNQISDPDTADLTDARLEARFNRPIALSIDKTSYANPVLYVADSFNKNIKMISKIDTDGGIVEGVNVNTANPLNVFEPRVLAISPGGKALYVGASSEYMVKKVHLDGRVNAVENIKLEGAPWAIFDLKILQEKIIHEDGKEEWMDRILFAFEVNKSDWRGRISYYDLKTFEYNILIGPGILNLGQFTGALTLNATGTKMWLTSRNLEGGQIYSVDLKYDDNGRPQTRNGSLNPTGTFLNKTGFFPAGLAYVKDPETYAEYLVLGYYEGANILTTTTFKMARLTLTWGGKTRNLDDLNPILPDDLEDEDGNVTEASGMWEYIASETFDAGYYYPRAMAAAGRYVYWTNNAGYKVYSIDATQTTVGQTPEEAFTLFQGGLIFATGFALDPSTKKFYFSNDLTNQVYGN